VIAVAESLVSKSTSTGREIGYFYADALVDMNGLLDGARAAVENRDTSVHSYREWAGLIDAEIERLKRDNSARACFKELDVYRIINSKEKACQLCYDAVALKANKQNQTAITSDNKKWMVESTGEFHHYYIKNKNGKYIDNCPKNGAVTCNGADSASAIDVKVNYTNDGRVYFTVMAGGEELYLTLDSDFNVVAGTALTDAAMWTVVRLEANNTGVDDVEGQNGNVKTIYDFQGRKTENPTTGIYIIDGKKVLIK
jgi:hypothetical protein